VAIVVPRYGHTVVERNRLRRLLREHLRTTLLHKLPAGDLVVKVLPSAYATMGLDLRMELTEVVVRLAGRTA
jgi:ribonuclease P protein component